MLAFLIIVPYRGGTIHFGVLSTPIEKEKRLLISRLGGVFCAGEGTRTHTLAHQILSKAFRQGNLDDDRDSAGRLGDWKLPSLRVRKDYKDREKSINIQIKLLGYGEGNIIRQYGPFDRLRYRGLAVEDGGDAF